MPYLEMGLAFVALGFVAATTGFALLTVLLWRVLRSRVHRPGSLFRLRMLPAIGSAITVLGVVVPAFLLFEPRDTTERAGPAVIALAAVALALGGAGLCRIVVSWRAIRRLERAWTSVARPSSSYGLQAPVYRVPSELPFAALVGVVRPRLFIADRFFDSLNEAEQHAVVQHEAAHLLARDNLKRAAMRIAPDWLAFTATGREIEAAWAVAAEEAADDRAAGADRVRALDLVSALLKAARHRPMRFATVANFCDAATIAGRAGRLLAGTPARRNASLSSAARLAVVLAAIGLAALGAGAVSSSAYVILETAIHALR